MKTLRVLYHLAHADFLERVRRYSFLITLGLTLYLGYVSVPPQRSRYMTMRMGNYRGLYNSAYIGTLEALFTALFVSFAGFYVVKNAIDRDLRTGVGQILATTPLRKPLYTLGKALSNFAVLTAMVGIMALAAGVMQLLRHEDLAIHPWKLLGPFLFIALPVMAVVAGVAVLFETIPGLRSGIGNVVYFFLWIAALSVLGDIKGWLGTNDLMGMGFVVPSIVSACKATSAGCPTNELSMGFNFAGDVKLWNLTTFRWEGVHWTLPIILGRLMWVGVAFGFALLASVFFHRFDPSRERAHGGAAAEEPGLSPALSTIAGEEAVRSPVLRSAQDTRPSSILKGPTVLQMPSAARSFRFGALVAAELRLALKGRNRWWYLVAAGLIVGGLVSPLVVSRGFLVAAWIWPLLIWSAMGTREARQGTDQLVFSTVYPLRRQLPACWLAGVTVAVMAGGGTLIRLLVARDGAGAFAWLVGALFIPTMALALGVWSGGHKLFEVLYTLLWYLGPVNRVPGLDFMGVTGPGGFGIARLFMAAALGLAVLAVIGRRYQLQN